MCKFFSFVTIPSENKFLYFGWKQRQAMIEGCDSHSHIVKYYEESKKYMDGGA
jgi:hypothetical protein